MNDEFEVGFDEPFERRWYRLELAGRTLILVFVLCGLAGLLGRGPFSHRRVEVPAAGMSVDFEPVARAQTPTQVTFHLAGSPGSGETSIFIDTKLIEPMGLQRVQPEPVHQQAVDGGIMLQFALPPGAGDAMVRLILQPSQWGFQTLLAKRGDAAPLVWHQMVLP